MSNSNIITKDTSSCVGLSNRRFAKFRRYCKVNYKVEVKLSSALSFFTIHRLIDVELALDLGPSYIPSACSMLARLLSPSLVVLLLCSGSERVDSESTSSHSLPPEEEKQAVAKSNVSASCHVSRDPPKSSVHAALYVYSGARVSNAIKDQNVDRIVLGSD